MFSNHTAPTLQVKTKDDPQAATVVIDPSYNASQPLTLESWRRKQNFPDAIITSGGILASPGTAPMHVHTEILSGEQWALPLDSETNQSIVAGAIERLSPVTSYQTWLAQTELTIEQSDH